jgi:hypothetical protein
MKIFHTFVMKSMFLCKQARQDVLLSIVFLATRVKESNKNNWKKPVRLMNYLQAQQKHSKNEHQQHSNNQMGFWCDPVPYTNKTYKWCTSSGHNKHTM